MLEGFALGSYLLLVDYSGRLFREGKAMISQEVAEIFERIGTTAETWQARLEKLSEGRLLGRYFAASRKRLREGAADLQRAFLEFDLVIGQPVRLIPGPQDMRRSQCPLRIAAC
jgi:hypothetical protein